MGMDCVVTPPLDRRLYITSQRSSGNNSRGNFFKARSRLEERRKMQFVELERKAGVPIPSISDYHTPELVPDVALLNAVKTF